LTKQTNKEQMSSGGLFFHHSISVRPFTVLSLHIKTLRKSIECSEWKNNNVSSSNHNNQKQNILAFERKGIAKVFGSFMCEYIICFKIKSEKRKERGELLEKNVEWVLKQQKQKQHTSQI
jgi:hypothetical protein